MKTESTKFVKCIKGHEGILEEGQYYTVVEITKKGNYILDEVLPPPPHTSFCKSRFGNPEDVSIIIEFLKYETI